MPLFSKSEDADLRHPRSRIDRQIHYNLSRGYGRFPDSACVRGHDRGPGWSGSLRGLGVRPEDYIDLVVTSDCHFATGWCRLGTKLGKWFPNARTTRA